jgi:MFS family permease
LSGPESNDYLLERRNFIVNIVEGALFIAGATFMSVQTVLPALVFRLGGSNLAVGALSVMAWGGLFLPQVFAARHVETLAWKKPWTIRLGLAARIIVGFMSLVLFILADTHRDLTLVLLLSLYALTQVLLGLTTPGWVDLVAKVTPVTRRGRLAGFRTSLAGGMGFACSFFLIWLLDSYVFPLNYAMAFGSAFLLQGISLLVQMRLVEANPSPVSERKSLVEFFREIADVLRSQANFRNFIVSMVFLVLATISIPFFTVRALDTLGGNALVVGEFTAVMVAAQVISAPLVGYVADRSGNRITLMLSALMLLFASLWATMAPSLEWYYPVFALLGVNIGSEVMCRYNIAIEFAPEKRRAAYLGMVNALLAPCYAIGIVGGVLSDQFGHSFVFLVGAVFSVAGILYLMFSVVDPRQREQRQE